MTTRRVYWLDTVKELVLSLVLGGVLLALVVWFYTWAGTYFWLYAWGAVTLFSRVCGHVLLAIDRAFV